MREAVRANRALHAFCRRAAALAGAAAVLFILGACGERGLFAEGAPGSWARRGREWTRSGRAQREQEAPAVKEGPFVFSDGSHCNPLGLRDACTRREEGARASPPSRPRARVR